MEKILSVEVVEESDFIDLHVKAVGKDFIISDVVIVKNDGINIHITGDNVDDLWQGDGRINQALNINKDVINVYDNTGHLSSTPAYELLSNQRFDYMRDGS